MDLSRPKAMLIASDDPRERWVVLAREPRAVAIVGTFTRAPRRARIAALALVTLLLSLGSLYGAWQGTAAGLANDPPATDRPIAHEETLPALLPGQPESRTVSAAAPSVSNIPAATARAAVPANAPRLRVAKIGVDMLIVEGQNERTLYRGAWRSPWNSTPDHGGNTVIFGHRYLRLPPSPETFYRLDELAVGDTFEISWGGKTYRYRVAETKVVPPTDLSALQPTGAPTVTLITCTPVFTTKNRLIVRGELIS